MLKLENISLFRGGQVLFQNLNSVVYPHNKIGIIGRNGCGKSSLFSLINGKLGLDNGVISGAKDIKIASVDQSSPQSELSALDFVTQGNLQYQAIQEKIKAAELQEDWDLLTKLYGKLDDIGGFDVPRQAGELLRGLGFKDETQAKAVNSFSGGWRSRLGLGKALMQSSDLLLLDEPTNHLDMQSIAWLENWLCNYTGAIMLISHDCAFIDKVVNQIYHIENNSIKQYGGNYSQFTQLKAEYSINALKQQNKRQKQAETLKAFVQKFRAKASKAKQVQSRIKAFARLESVEDVFSASPFKFDFKEPQNCPAILTRINKANLGYNADSPILRNVKLHIPKGARIGLIGENGAGKSTLIKSLSGQLPSLSGEILCDKNLNIGYFAQHHVEHLDMDRHPVAAFQHQYPKVLQREAREYLGSFNFTGDKALQPLKTFSGGERARFVLALINWQAPNLLLLDEPTNHLDLEMREALTMSLQAYSGAIVLVSHDRQLLKENCEELYILEDRLLKNFDEDIDDYFENLKKKLAS